MASDDVAVAREPGRLGPLELQRLAESDRPQTGEAVMAGELFGQSHVFELAHGTRRQAVAAGLLTREALLLDEQHVVAGLGQPVGACGARGPATHDEDVMDGGAGTHFSPSRSKVTTFLISASVSVPLNGGMPATLTMCWPPDRPESP